MSYCTNIFILSCVYFGYTLKEHCRILYIVLILFTIQHIVFVLL
nr:MAG TPA: hypothetical protein [Caudoviricetes sp.]